MRFTWLSNAPWTTTGYANQTRLTVPRLKDAGHEPAIIAFYGLEGGVQSWNGINVYPRYRHLYGMDVAIGHTRHHRGDALLALMDAWVLEPDMLRPVDGAGLRWIPYYPVDCDPLPKPIHRVVSAAYDRITMSRYGERVTEEAGLTSTYIPHGYDPTVHYPRSKRECRERLKWDQDRFTVVMVGANKGLPARKSFPQHFDAFSRLVERHADAWLYVHSHSGIDGGLGGYNLVEMVERYGIGDRTVIADPYQYVLGYPDEYLAAVYNAADVVLHVSMGEGFGIPIIEAQACGTPVIVGDWTSMGELCKAGWKILQRDAERFYMPIGGFQWLPHVGAIADCLLLAYDHRDQLASDEMRTAASLDMRDRYTIDHVVATYWLPYLETLEHRIAEEQRVRGAVQVHRPVGITPRQAGARVPALPSRNGEDRA